ncbi:MAG: hypothetical protein LBV52_05240 [Spirochaetaceae bacterium]|jgi:hypothetical protein|nr:hypothetical protein [Spirochaetaceae bacterium]
MQSFKALFAYKILLCLAVLSAFSCSINEKALRTIDNAVIKEKFQDGLKELDEAQEKKQPLFTKKNIILLYLNRGQIAHYAGKWDESIKYLQAAEKSISDAFAKSISENVASYILNDNVKDYTGEDYEDVYLNVFCALDYYFKNDIDGALVEIRRSNEKLRVLANKYENINQEMKKNYADNLKNVKQLNTKPVQFSNSALTDYLGALFYIADGSYDDARVNMVQLQQAFQTAPNVYSNSIPPSLVLSGNYGSETCKELQRPKEMGRLNIVSFTGLSPIKKEEIFPFVLPFKYGLDYAQIRYPVLSPRGDTITKISVSVYAKGDDKTPVKMVELDLLEDIGKAITDTFNARQSVIMLKTVIRTIVKYASVYVLAEAGAQAADSEAVGMLTALAAKTAFDASERADVRMERYLPAKAWVGYVDLPPDNYTVKTTYFSGSSKASVNVKSIQVYKGELNILEDVCLK